MLGICLYSITVALDSQWFDETAHPPRPLPQVVDAVKWPVWLASLALMVCGILEITACLSDELDLDGAVRGVVVVVVVVGGGGA